MARIAALVALVALALLALSSLSLAAASPSLASLTADLSLLEQAAKPSDAATVLEQAQEYANKKLAAATEESRKLLAKAAAEGRAEAAEAGPAPAAAPLSEKLKLQIEQKEKLAAQKLQAAADAKKALEAKQASEAATQRAKKRKERLAALLSPFSGQQIHADRQGVFGGVQFGLAKRDSVPTAKARGRRPAPGSALERFSKYGPKRNIYGRKKSCLKDIAAHFDEKDIYESKKFSLLQRMEHAKSRRHAYKLRRKLVKLETWHQMMQKKFVMSARKLKQHRKRVARLMDEHLPQHLKDQLQANKMAKDAGQRLPFPHAHQQAMQAMRRKRKEIAKKERLYKVGGKRRKRMLRPEINNKEFPSMDPISSELREKLWRNIKTHPRWSTDRGELEVAEGVVTKAHKAHSDFFDGPIAEPLLKGKLYHPKTEKLGVPDFLKLFPWPKQPPTQITMDDKVKVEQTYHQTW